MVAYAVGSQVGAQVSGQLPAAARKALQPTETVHAWVQGISGKPMGKGEEAQHTAFLVASDARLTMVIKRWFSSGTVAIDLANIRSIQTDSFFASLQVEIDGGGQKILFSAARAKMQAFLEQLELLRARPGAGAPQATSPQEPLGSAIEVIQQLAALRDQGILSDDEFAAKKAELLARL